MSTAPTARIRSRRRSAALAAGLAGILSLATGLTMIAAAGSAAATGKPDPGGNNGTVKVAGIGDLDQVPDNEPHLGCTFTVQWYDYQLPAHDPGPVQATVSFAAQAPTPDSALRGVSGDLTPSFTPLPPSGAGSGPDHEEVYTLTLAGTAQPQQGYHVKLTVHTPYSKGSDVKHKVFWVGPCTSPSPSPSGSVSPSVSPSPSGSVSPSVNPSPSGSVSPSVGPTGSVSPSPSPSVSPSVGPSGSLSPSQTVSPSESVRPSRSPTVAGTESVSAAPTVQGTGHGNGATVLPTVVAAGQGGPGDGATAVLVAGRSLTALGVALLALAGALALGRRPGDHEA